MNLFGLVEKSRLTYFHRTLRCNVDAGVEYKWIEQADKLIEHLSDNESQRKIISDKFENLENEHQFFDKTVELLAAYRFLDEDPRLLEEQGGDADILLQTSGKKIEVKRLNPSDDSKLILNQMIPGATHSINDLGIRDYSSDKQALISQVNSKITQALDQIGEDDGIVVLVYSIDPFADIDPEYIESIASDIFAEESSSQHRILVTSVHQFFTKEHGSYGLSFKREWECLALNLEKAHRTLSGDFCNTLEFLLRDGISFKFNFEGLMQNNYESFKEAEIDDAAQETLEKIINCLEARDGLLKELDIETHEATAKLADLVHT